MSAIPLTEKAAPTVRGSIVEATKAWILEHHSEMWDIFLDEFPIGEREVWTAEQINPAEWLPASIYQHTYEAFGRLLGQPMFRHAAGEVALAHIGTWARFFLRIGTPSMTLKMLPGAYGQLFSAGSFRVLRTEPRSATTELTGATEYGPASCLGTEGWIDRILRHVGAEGLRISQSECCFRGGSRCVFEFSWR